MQVWTWLERLSRQYMTSTPDKKTLLFPPNTGSKWSDSLSANRYLLCFRQFNLKNKTLGKTRWSNRGNSCRRIEIINFATYRDCFPGKTILNHLELSGRELGKTMGLGDQTDRMEMHFTGHGGEWAGSQTVLRSWSPGHVGLWYRHAQEDGRPRYMCRFTLF